MALRPNCISTCWAEPGRATPLRKPTRGLPTYVNPHFAEAELGALHEVIDRCPFALLVAPTGSAVAAHIPFVLHPDEGPFGTLVAHTARADPIAAALDGATELLVVFQGPSAYVRSRWYVNPGLPTYNFLAVHAYGRAIPLTDRDAVLTHLAELVDLHEAAYEDRFSLAEADEAYLSPLLAHIAPFFLEIQHIEGKLKLSQNRAAADRAAVISALRERGDEDDRAIAQAMEQYAYRGDEAQPLIAASPTTPPSSLAQAGRQETAPMATNREGTHGE